MQVFWEQIGVLGPIYRLVGGGLNDGDIATHLGLTEVSVQDCIAWLLRFWGFTNREELALYAHTQPVEQRDGVRAEWSESRISLACS
jgi:hypothetical protein